MNVPVSPPVDLRNLRELAPETAEKKLSRAIVVRRRRLADVAAPALALGLGVIAATGVLAWRGATAELDRRRRRSGLLLAGGLGLAAIGLGAWQLQRWSLPSPPYEVELRAGRFEVRRYPSLQVAETKVDAPWDHALMEGFRRLAGFILRDNDAQQEIAMTVPVLGTGGEDGYRLSLIMPDDVLVPAPTDARVALANVPARRVAVLRFTGRYTAENLAAHKQALARALARRGLEPKGEAMFAGYDPPSTIPLLRRTELWVELA
ncbi:MAG: heme-binding protein [Labilithrix sp.]|nr:heme-binding protein [Labilithrix sp.]MCW5815980.1 heme-binding protein [Labilithrix sp.]